MESMAASTNCSSHVNYYAIADIPFSASYPLGTKRTEIKIDRGETLKLARLSATTWAQFAHVQNKRRGWCAQQLPHLPRVDRKTRAMNADQALELVLDGTTDELDSGEETDIDEDASFPLPVDEESEQSEYEGKLYFLSSTNNVQKNLQ